jgi:hypothetical protein
MDQVRALTKTEATLVAQALRNEADRVMALGLNADLMAAVVSTEGLDDEVRSRLTNRAVGMTKKVDALELLADIIGRHGALITGPMIIPELG